MGHNDSIQTWQLGLLPVRHLFILRMEPASVRPPTVEPPSAPVGLGLQPRRRPPASASALVGLGSSRPRSQSASVLSLGVSPQLGLGSSRPRSQSALVLSLGPRRRPPALASAPVGLGSSRPRSQSASVLSLSPQPRHRPPVGLGPGVPSVSDLVSCCLEPHDSHVVHQPSMATTWSTISYNNRPSQARRGHALQRRNDRPRPATACDSCPNQNSTCQPAAATYSGGTRPAA